MSRITLKEKLERQKIDISAEFDKLYAIASSTFFCEALDLYLPFLPYKCSEISYKQFIKQLFKVPLNYEEDVLDLLEIIQNNVFFIRENYKNAGFFSCEDMFIGQSHEIWLEKVNKIVEIDAASLGYRFIKDPTQKYYFLSKIDEVAEIIAEKYPSIKWRILEFYSPSKTHDIDHKIDTITAFYKILDGKNREILKTKFGKTSYIEKLLTLAQQCRHGEEKVEPFPFFTSNKEYWCNLMYELFLEVFLTLDNIDKKEELTSNLNSFFEQK